MKEKIICLFCNKELFIDNANFALHVKKHGVKSEDYYLNYLKKEKTFCIVCGKKAKFKNMFLGYDRFCSRECGLFFRDKHLIKIWSGKSKEEKKLFKEKCQKTCLEKYGDKNGKSYGSKAFKDLMEQKYGNRNFNNHKKAQETCLVKYGDSNYGQYGSNRFKEILVDKYGVEFYSQVEGYKEQKENTLQKRYGNKTYNNRVKAKEMMFRLYGGETTRQSPSLLLKSLETKRKEYFNKFKTILCERKIECLFEEIDFIKSENNELNFKCLICGKYFASFGKNTQHVRCGCLATGRSFYEVQLKDWIESLKLDVVTNKRFSFEGLIRELDCYIPSHKLGIDFHGLYHHSELNKDKLYHLQKFCFFLKQNIRCIQVFENEWLYKNEIVKSIVTKTLNLSLKINSDDCVFKLIDENNFVNFLNENHIGGFLQSEIMMGVFFNEEIVSVIGLNQNCDDWEITIQADKCGIEVVGLLEKFLSYFLENHEGNLIAFCDNRYFSGVTYIENGFEIVEKLIPNFYYWENNSKELINNSKIQNLINERLKLYKDVDDIYNLTDNGFYRIYDAGTIKLKYRRTR